MLARLPSVYIYRVYLVFSVGLLQLSLHRLVQIQISVKLSNPSRGGLSPLLSRSVSLSTSCTDKVCWKQERHKTCKWAASEGKWGEDVADDKQQGK